MYILSSYIVPAAALYFYVDQNTPKCFFEDLPKDTLVVGRFFLFSSVMRDG